MAASPALELVHPAGWRTGFANILRKEFGSWWSTRRWLVHLVLWLVVINAFILLVALSSGGPKETPAKKFAEVVEVFFRVGGLWATIGAILCVQSSIVGERQMGTGAWILSKPASRTGFVLAKLVANGVSFLLLAVAIPTLVLHVETLAIFHRIPETSRFLGGLGVHVLHLVFYLTLTIMLGTLVASRGPVTGGAVGALFAGFLLPNWLPKAVTAATPWMLPQLSALFASDKAVPASSVAPILATAAWSVAFVIVALRRFDREEF